MYRYRILCQWGSTYLVYFRFCNFPPSPPPHQHTPLFKLSFVAELCMPASRCHLVASCVVLGECLDLSVPQFSPETRGQRSCFIGFLRTELTVVRWVDQHLETLCLMFGGFIHIFLVLVTSSVHPLDSVQRCSSGRSVHGGGEGGLCRAGRQASIIILLQLSLTQDGLPLSSLHCKERFLFLRRHL